MVLRSSTLALLVAILSVLVAPTVASADTPRILVLGDSLSAGYGMTLEEGWVALLQARLVESGYEYEVVNASISGDTTQGGRARLPRALELHQPSIVILELGGNDGLRGIPVEVLRSNLETMVEASRGAGAEVLLLGIQIPANYGPSYTEALRSSYGELAAREGVGLVPFFMEGVALDPELMQADGIHPNAAGQTRLLENVWSELQPMLRERAPG